jgi:predicted dehydrogenase
MSEPLRVAVIGAGGFGERHLAAYARQPGVEVVAVADRDHARAREVAARWGVADAFADAAELVGACRPGAVSVVTPGSAHVEPALAALEHGAAVLLEKPVATTSADVAQIAAAAQRCGGIVVPAHILRFAAPYAALRERVRAGAVGELLGLAACRDRSRAHARAYADVHPALMTTIHDIDLALWITGARALRVSAHERGRGVGGDDGPPLLVWAQVEASDGSVWSLRVSWLLPRAAPPGDRLEVYGSEGAAVLELAPTVTVLGAGADGAERVEPVDHELTPEALPGAIDAEVAHFCACVRAGVPSDVVTLAEAAHGVAIAEALATSAAAGGAWTDVAA